MNQALFGSTIAAQRKQKKMTQAALANILNISDKTVSKWENGLGYPELSVIPQLAKALGVTIDYLFTGERSGITIVGNLNVHYLKIVEDFQQNTKPINIVSVTRHIGGCVPNIALNLAGIDISVPVAGIGCIGDDDVGHYILSKLQSHGINISGILSTDIHTGNNETIYCKDHETYMFRFLGANSLLSPANIDVAGLTSRIVHFGRLSLFPAYWEKDPEYGNGLARMLHEVQETGAHTSIAIMGNTETPSLQDMIPAFARSDYVMLHLAHLYKLFDIPAGTVPDNALLLRLMQRIFDYGVSEKIFLFVRDCQGYSLSRNGVFSSARLQDSSIDEEVFQLGIADDLCAGCLYGLYCAFPDEDIISFACGVAQKNLISMYSGDRFLSKKEIIKIVVNRHVDSFREHN